MDPEICGATAPGPDGDPTYWVCVLPPHNPGYRRRTGDASHQGGQVVYGTNSHPERGGFAGVPPADRHWFKKRRAL